MQILNLNESLNDIIDCEFIQSCYQTKTWHKNYTLYNNGKFN
jgi:hypothetical protein